MRTSVSLTHSAPCGRLATGRPITSARRRVRSRRKERGERSKHAVPGFRAHASSASAVLADSYLPGFGARRYRDSGHALAEATPSGRTGIPGTPLPGVGAYGHREAEHTRTGIRDTKWGADTGIPGTSVDSNSPTGLPKLTRNSVFGNSSRNTTTGGASFLGRGGR